MGVSVYDLALLLEARKLSEASFFSGKIHKFGCDICFPSFFIFNGICMYSPYYIELQASIRV